MCMFRYIVCIVLLDLTFSSGFALMGKSPVCKSARFQISVVCSASLDMATLDDIDAFDQSCASSFAFVSVVDSTELNDEHNMPPAEVQQQVVVEFQEGEGVSCICDENFEDWFN